MDIDSLRCFDAVATTLRFRSAAKRVALSPAALSDRIQRLEEELGQRLFVRTTRQVGLSEAGSRLLPHARELIRRADELHALARGGAGPTPFELTIGTRYELGLSWLCPSLVPLEEQAPHRALHLYFADTPDLMLRLKRGELDAIVTSSRLSEPKLRYATLHEERYVLVTAPGVRLRGPEDARKLKLVDATPDLPLFRYFLDALPDATPWPFERIEYMGGIGGIRSRLLSGDRVAVLPQYFVRPDLKARRLSERMRQVKLRVDAFRLVWPLGHPREAELVQLAEELRDRPLV